MGKRSSEVSGCYLFLVLVLVLLFFLFFLFFYIKRE
jgi:hypothetical protein